MKLARFVCLFMLFAVPLLGQSNPAAQSHQPRSSTVERRTSPQTSGGSFAPAVAYDSGGQGLVSLAVADVNGDGKLDVLVTATLHTPPYGGVGVLLGQGDGTFPTAVQYGSGGSTPTSIAVADVNGDGKPDLLVANGCISDTNCDKGAVGVLLGNGDGTFQPAVAYNSGAWGAQSVAVADVNGDGKPDLVVANQCVTATVCTNGLIGVLLGNGDGTFRAALTYDSGGVDAYSVALADVNSDGKLDLLVGNFCSTACDGSLIDGAVAVLLGNGDGTFHQAVVYDTGGFWTLSVQVSDVNGDGKPDLVVENSGSNSAGVLLGNGDGTFQAAQTYLTGPDVTVALSMIVADVNGDGKPDLVVTNEFALGDISEGRADVLLGNGDGTFQAVVAYEAGGYGTNWGAVGDVNGDGKTDLLIGNPCQNEFSCAYGTVSVRMNTTPTITATSLVSSLNPSSPGQTVTFTATVTPQYEFGKSTPTGSVNFFDGKTGLGHAVLNSSGIAMLSTSALSIGTHSITARYNGDPNFLSSTSQVLSQVVQGAILQLTPTSVNFGNVTIGSTVHQGVLVNLLNTGNIALTISSIAITGTDSADFIQSNLCPSSLAAGTGCTATVQFIPTMLGTRTAALTVTDNAANSPQLVSLTGVGVQPAVTLSPASLSFPTQIVFTNSKTQTVTLSNTGLGTLSITQIAISGPFTQTNNCGSTVNAGRSCTLTVTFRPTTAGSIPGSLSITDNAPLSPQTVSLIGTGTYVEFNPSTFNFGNQPVGTKSLPKKITLSNKGSVAVSITKISLIGANAGNFAETNTCGNSVAAGASCFITVTFTPSAAGKRTANVSVIDNGGGSPQTVSLTGTGT